MVRATPITPPPIGAIHIGDRKVQLGAPLGKGSMATVYRAILESANGVRRAVACKVFGTVSSEDQEPMQEMLRGAVQRTACIRHPNVAHVYEYGVNGTQAYLVNELVDGTSLRLLIDTLTLRGRRMALDLGLFIATEIADGLNGARVARSHDGVQMGISHLDLSTRDVLLSWGGEVKLTDFAIGAARHAASSVRNVTKLARRVDTMSPEVARGASGDARSDVFSLGIMMREMLIGQRFPRTATDADALRHARDGFVQPITFEPHLPDEVRTILKRALEIEPEKRYPHAGAMAYDLRRVALTLGVGDSRVFLRTMLGTELALERSDATLEFPIRTRSSTPAAASVVARVPRPGSRHDDDK